MVLNTGRIRDSMAHHDANRPFRLALRENIPEPFVDIHPQDALLMGCSRRRGLRE